MSDRELDQALVERAQKGDKRAFELLVIKYQRKLGRLLSRMVRDAAEVEDITQETFIKAYRALPGFRGESAFYTWLYRIAVHLCLHHRKRSGRVGPVAELPDTPAPGPQPLYDLLEAEQRQAVALAIAALPPQQRAALTLRVHHNLSYKEIGEILQCSAGAARANVFHAIQKLRVQLAGFGEDS